MDGLLHRAEGRTQYADFSGWDSYRTQIQLLSILAPKRASEMVRSLLADADESGCLPRWPYANGQSMTMVGDSADPLIASAAAFGAKAFDRQAALAAMLRGADGECRSANGEYLERQGLAPYLALGYVPFDLDTNVRNANSIYGSPDDVWGSAATSLEYTVDDFAIGQFAARALGDSGTYQRFMQRSGNWRKLFDRHSKMIEPRYENGAFPAHYDNLGGGGFVEGDSAQYSWAVPHDPAGLFRQMGGRTKAADRLGRFLRKLNAGPGGTHADHALLGNEPTLHVPWLYDWLRRPYGTQAAVRRGLRLYSPSPSGYPGNDDLGTLSSWYVFGALGLYPEVPGVGLLAIGSPLFGHASVALAHHRRLTISAAARETQGRGKKMHAAAISPSRAPYIDGLSLNGHRANQPWTTWCALSRGADLTFELSPAPESQVGQLCHRGAALLRPRPRDAERRLHTLTLAPSRNGALWALALLTALGAAMRFASLDVQSYHHDEVITAMRVIPGSFSDMLHAVKNSESNPPLYYVLAWGWAKAFGTHEVGLRSLSALLGTATVPLAYCIGAELAQPPRRPDRRRACRGQPDVDLVLAGGPLLRRCWSSSAPSRCSSSFAPCAPAAAATSPSGRSPRRSPSAATTSPSSRSRSRRSGC